MDSLSPHPFSVSYFGFSSFILRLLDHSTCCFCCSSSPSSSLFDHIQMQGKVLGASFLFPSSFFSQGRVSFSFLLSQILNQSMKWATQRSGDGRKTFLVWVWAIRGKTCWDSHTSLSSCASKREKLVFYFFLQGIWRAVISKSAWLVGGGFPFVFSFLLGGKCIV